MNMSTNIDINKLLEKALEKNRGGVSAWYERIPKEAEPFINGIKDMVAEGKRPIPSNIVRILNDEFGFEISRSRVSVWLQGLANE